MRIVLHNKHLDFILGASLTNKYYLTGAKAQIDVDVFTIIYVMLFLILYTLTSGPPFTNMGYF